MGKLHVDAIEFDELTTAQIFALNPGTNELAYNSELGKYYFWDGSKWREVSLGAELFLTHFEEDFETGSFTDNGWVTVQGGENDWFVGTAAKASGTYGAYISTDGGTSNTYSSVGGSLDVSHLYIDILLPAGPLNSLVMEFDWRCEGEIGFDAMQIRNVPTTTTPVANTELVDPTIGLLQYNDQATFIQEQIALDTAQAGTTRRFVFSWRNDSSVENQPPICFDNFKILYN